MKFIVNKDGKIEFSSEPLKEGLNIIGNVNGVMIPGTFELRPLDENEDNSKLSPTQTSGAAIFIFLKDKNYFERICSDLSGVYDIFWGRLASGEYVIGNDFFETLSQFPNLTLNGEEIVFFMKHGYFPPGKTFFKEISRVKAGCELFFQNNCLQEKNILPDYRKERRDFLSFKKAFSSVFNCYRLEEDDVILLSGGCDSGLVAALLASKFPDKRLLAVTAHYKNPTLAANKRDVAVSQEVTKFWGIPHQIVDLDWNEVNLTALDNYVKTIPLSAHFAMGHYTMLKNNDGLGKKKLWAGENADDIYDLGTSKDGPANTLRRFYLSREYIRTLSDVKGNVLKTPLIRLAGGVGNFLLKRKKGLETRQPDNFQEFFTAFRESEGLWPLPLFKKKNFKDRETIKMIDSLEARKILFDDHLQTTFIGPCSRVIQGSGSIFRFKETILPHSAVNMIHYFRRLEIGLRDVIQPKRFIPQYLEEIMGKKEFKRIYCLTGKSYLAKGNIYGNFDYWSGKIIKETKFGQELADAVKNADLPLFLDDDSLDIWQLAFRYWVINVIKQAEKMGLKISL